MTGLGGSALAVSRRGDGPPLVLLPGIGLSRSTWARSSPHWPSSST